jgi:hypothetical protein
MKIYSVFVLLIMLLSINCKVVYGDKLILESQEVVIANDSITEVISAKKSLELYSSNLQSVLRTVFQPIKDMKDNVNGELYDGDSIPKDNRISKLNGFYDKRTDTIFLNVAKVNISKCYGLSNIVVKLNKLRFEVVAEYLNVKPGLIRIKEQAMDALAYQFYKKPKKVDMRSWLERNRKSDIILEGTNKAFKVENPIAGYKDIE